MSKICDRSPCDGLLSMLGDTIFGIQEKGASLFALILTTTKLENKTIPITYCPFCGTRIEEIDTVTITKFLKSPVKEHNKLKIE